MAAPFVQVNVSDQSIYSAPSPSTIPLLVVATRSNKITPDGSGIAAGTMEANKLRLVTSQRELNQNYGEPVFVTASGSPVHGDETNEYGLLAAHSFLGRSSRAYILRADVDLGQLLPTTVEPVLPPPDGTYWIRKDSVVGGIFRYDGSTWTAVNFSVVTTLSSSYGSDGDWVFDYSTIEGTIKFKHGGNWFAATDTILSTQLGGSVNLHVSATSPISPDAGDFWYKTTQSSGGVNLQLSRYRAVDGVFVTQAVIRQNTMPTPNEDTIWEDISTINSSGVRTLYIGTGTGFIPLDVYVQDTQPFSEPDKGTLWYDDTITDFALYVEGTDYGYGNQWVPVVTVTASNPSSTQKVISASAPQFPNDGAIWVDLSTAENIDNYPVIKRYSAGSWIDITDAVVMQPTDPGATLVSNGTYWFNTGESRSKNTIKSYNSSFQAKTVVFSGGSYVVQNETGNYWEPAVGSIFGRKAQRELVVRKLQAAITSNQQIRAQSNYFQLIAAPAYPELYDDMVALNTDNKEVSFCVADTPKFMVPTGIPEGREITAPEWITNARNAVKTGEEGFISAATPYAAFWYPWCLTTNVNGLDVFAPPSHMALRTIAYSDSVAAPWFPPAGYTRGRVDNATSVGYLNNEGDYAPLELTPGMMNVLYDNRINSISFEPDRGLTIMGQKTISAITSALDRINVSRLVVKMKYDLKRLLSNFLMELNDPVTRRSAQVVTERYLSGLKSLRALYDYAVRCDEQNNTSDRIDRNELWIDVAIKPAKAIEFIYVPLTLYGTGDDFPF